MVTYSWVYYLAYEKYAKPRFCADCYKTPIKQIFSHPRKMIDKKVVNVHPYIISLQHRLPENKVQKMWLVRLIVAVIWSVCI